MKKDRLSLLAFALAVAGIVFLAMARQLFAAHPVLIGVQVGAVALMIWARVTFGLRSFHAGASTSEGGLVTHGPYRWWRHPIYASIVYFVWAGQIETRTLRSLAAAALVTAALLVRMLLEETNLLEAYPEYSGYCRRAKRFVPFLF